MCVQEAIEILRDEQKLLINAIAVYSSDYLGLSETKIRELTMINKKELKLLTWQLKHWEVEKMKSKNGNMSAFIYGKPTGGSRYVGSKKKRKTTRINKSKKVVS
nr:MAG TPA: hypothetical protein [Bacteriophage sp.]